MVDATRLGAWLRSGEGIGWLAAGVIPNSLYRVPFFYLFLGCVFCCCSFLFVVSVLLRYIYIFALVGTFVDVPLIFFSVQQITYRIGYHVYYWVRLRPDRTTTYFHTYLRVVCVVSKLQNKMRVVALYWAIVRDTVTIPYIFKESLNASRPSEHPPNA